MKYLFAFVLSIMFFAAKSQTVGELIWRVSNQDKHLDTVFSKFKLAEWKSDSSGTILWVKKWIDSATKYTALSEKYLAEGNLDSCIEAIHLADKYIILSKKQLKITHDND